MEAMMSQINALDKRSSMAELFDKFEALAMREKKLIFIATPCLILFVMSLLLIEPAYKDIQVAQSRMSAQQSQLDALKQTSDELMLEIKRDPDAYVKQQIEALQRQLNIIAESFDSELGQLVSPKAMPVLLENLFNKAEGLTLLEMQSLAPTPVFTGDSSNQEAQLYRQGIRIRFQGDFFATQGFFTDAETLRWKLYWKFLSYDVDAHPMATIELEVFTLSTSEAFIGVQ
jgi:MSHA biogenesis protein MshJ